jgi:hypothetical protein
LLIILAIGCIARFARYFAATHQLWGVAARSGLKQMEYYGFATEEDDRVKESIRNAKIIRLLAL